MQFKLIIQVNENRAIIGVQQPDTDPYIETATGTVPEILAAVPTVIAAAELKWATTKKNPAIVLPKPATPPAPAPTAATASPSKAKPTKSTPQTAMFG
jgi:hypothetical protein